MIRVYRSLSASMLLTAMRLICGKKQPRKLIICSRVNIRTITSLPEVCKCFSTVLDTTRRLPHGCRLPAIYDRKNYKATRIVTRSFCERLVSLLPVVASNAWAISLLCIHWAKVRTRNIPLIKIFFIYYL